MNNGVKSLEVLGGQVSNVLAHSLRLAATGEQGAFAEVTGIQPMDFIAGIQKVALKLGLHKTLIDKPVTF